MKKKHTGANPANMRWEANTSKREADNMMFRSMAFDIQKMVGRNKGGRVRVLSLPGTTWLWELGLEDSFSMAKFEFLGLERDLTVWRKMNTRALALPGNFRSHHTPLGFSDFAGQWTRRNKPFDVIYLDWMGTWSKDKKADIDLLLGKDMLAPGGVLILTVALRRGWPDTLEELQDLSHELPFAFYDARGRDKYVDNIKVRGIPHWVEQRAEEQHGIKLRPLMASIYYSTAGEQVQPQLQLLFTREQEL